MHELEQKMATLDEVNAFERMRIYDAQQAINNTFNSDKISTVNNCVTSGEMNDELSSSIETDTLINQHFCRISVSETRNEQYRPDTVKSSLNDKRNINESNEMGADFLITSLSSASIATANSNNNSSSSYPVKDCSSQARQDDSDISVDELAAYFDLQVHIPKKMSFMAELMYT